VLDNPKPPAVVAELYMNAMNWPVFGRCDPAGIEPATGEKYHGNDKDYSGGFAGGRSASLSRHQRRNTSSPC